MHEIIFNLHYDHEGMRQHEVVRMPMGTPLPSPGGTVFFCDSLGRQGVGIVKEVDLDIRQPDRPNVILTFSSVSM